MTLHGTIRSITTRINISGDKTQKIVLEVHGDISPLNSLIESPLVINLEAE